MNELIKITYNNDRPAVSARDLHDFLEVGARYNDWFPRMCEYGRTVFAAMASRRRCNEWNLLLKALECSL